MGGGLVRGRYLEEEITMNVEVVWGQCAVGQTIGLYASESGSYTGRMVIRQIQQSLSLAGLKVPEMESH